MTTLQRSPKAGVYLRRHSPRLTPRTCSRGRNGTPTSGARGASPSSVIVLYLLTATGHLTSGRRCIAMYRTAHQLVSAGQVAVPPSPEAPAGRDGRHYAKYGLGQSLVELPLVLLGHTLATLTNQPDDRLTQFWASLTNTFVSVGIVLVWWRFARDLGYTRPVATAGAVTLASASLLWPYARADFSEPLLALTLLSTAWCLYRWHSAPPRAWVWALAAGACGGFAFVTKPTAAILCPAFALYALWLLRSGGRSWGQRPAVTEHEPRAARRRGRLCAGLQLLSLRLRAGPRLR